MRYEFTGVGTGTLGTTPFTNAPFVINLMGDTANIIRVGSDVHSLDGTSTFFIDGLGLGDFTQPTRVFSNVGVSAIGFSRGTTGTESPTDLIDLHDPAFAGYDLRRPFPLFREEDPTAVGQFRNVSTSRGLLTFSSIDYVTFQAFPEPASAAILAAVGTAAALRRRRR